MDELQLRERIRRLHESGEVPCDTTPPGTVWAGPGTGDLCILCVAPIQRAEVEFEIQLSSGGMFRVHRRCYAIWLEECGSIVGQP